MSGFLSTHHRPSVRLAQALEKVVMLYGERELARLIQQEMAKGTSDPGLIPDLDEFKSRALGELLNAQYELKRFLKAFSLPPPLTLLKRFRQTLIFRFGYFTSWLIPQGDIQVISSAGKQDKIFFHRPWVLSSNVFIRWVRQILLLCHEETNLSEQDRKLIAWLETEIARYQNGIQKGVYEKELFIKLLQSLRVIKRRTFFEVNVNPRFFEWLASQIGALH